MSLATDYRPPTTDNHPPTSLAARGYARPPERGHEAYREISMSLATVHGLPTTDHRPPEPYVNKAAVKK